MSEQEIASKAEILDKDGKPIVPKWESMNQEEKLFVLRNGMGYIINLTVAINQKLDLIINAMREADNNEAKEQPIEQENKNV